MSMNDIHLQDPNERAKVEAILRNTEGWIEHLALGTGWLPEPESDKDWKFSAIINGEYAPDYPAPQPEATTNTNGVTRINPQFIPRIQDQYYQGACTGGSVANAVGTIARLDPETDWETDYSWQWLYNLGRRAIGELHLDEGAYIRDVVDAARVHGVARESDFPYYRYQETQNVDPLTNDKWVDSAKSWKLGEHRKLQNLAEVKEAIKMGYPIVFGFLCYQNLGEAWSTGRIPDPSGYVTGGHAVMGAEDDEPNRFISGPNTWGREWARSQPHEFHGWYHLPYSFFETGKCSDMWALIGESAETYHHGPNRGRSQ